MHCCKSQTGLETPVGITVSVRETKSPDTLEFSSRLPTLFPSNFRNSEAQATWNSISRVPTLTPLSKKDKKRYEEKSVKKFSGEGEGRVASWQHHRTQNHSARLFYMWPSPDRATKTRNKHGCWWWCNKQEQLNRGRIRREDEPKADYRRIGTPLRAGGGLTLGSFASLSAAVLPSDSSALVPRCR